jgi:hypothetical protein
VTTEARRNALYSRLQEVLGDEPAATLMTMFPGGEPATKTDLEEVRAAMKTDLEEVRAELKSDIAEVRAELKSDIAEVRAELGALRSEMREEIVSVRAELLDIRTDIRELRSTVQSNARTFVVTQTSTVIAVAGMVLAFDRLL